MIHMGSSVKIRIGVLMGGKSEEREVSFNSGRTICDHIDTSKYEVIPIFQTFKGDLYILPWYFLHRGKISDFYDRLDSHAKKIDWQDLKLLIDFLYISVHGRFAEDGTLQGILEILKIPYLGSKVFASALGMNKLFQKKFLKLNGIDVAKGISLTSKQIKNLSLEEILKYLEKENLKFPIIIKPVHEGSSLGVSVVNNNHELLPALTKASTCDSRVDQEVLIEEKLEGMEFVCVCLQKDDKSWFSFPITEVVPESEIGFYDYVQKYMPGRATKITPARCSEKDTQKIIETCQKATQILDFTTISRIDGFLTKDGRIVIIDPNTLTGMGPATFLFHQAAEYGMNHSQLINYLVETELKNTERALTCL